MCSRVLCAEPRRAAAAAGWFPKHLTEHLAVLVLLRALNPLHISGHIQLLLAHDSLELYFEHIRVASALPAGSPGCCYYSTSSRLSRISALGQMPQHAAYLQHPSHCLQPALMTTCIYPHTSIREKIDAPVDRGDGRVIPSWSTEELAAPCIPGVGNLSSAAQISSEMALVGAKGLPKVGEGPGGYCQLEEEEVRNERPG
ncbi:hypothetical protein H4582DRAFT_531517 [Lactarius indigo]|nr:hypothetical protein H4582DRAFT_531517 [Lactarius indigo]